MKWKAVGYNKPDRIIAHTVDAQLRVDGNETSSLKVDDDETSFLKVDETSSLKVYETSFLKVNINDTDVLNRVMKGFFGSVNVSHAMDISITKFNMTFQVGEEYYSKSNYTSFSMIMGLGDYEEEQGLSFMVKIIIVTGFGIPVIAIIASALFLAIKWRRRIAYRTVLH